MTFRLLAVSDRHALAEPFAHWVRRLAAAGVDGLQLRDKELSDRARLALARVAARELAGGPTRLVVNGRVDVAVAAGAAGVHLPADELPAAAVRRLAPGLLVGRSCHSADDVGAAREEGCDYAVFGPVYPTPGKGSGRGLDELAAAAAHDIPVLAVGGIEAPRLGEVAAAGAAGAAAIRACHRPAELASLVAAAREAWA